jgi:hypothetical protein
MTDSKTKPATATLPATHDRDALLKRQREAARRALLKRRQRKSNQ